MIKIEKANAARIVKTAQGWYILWYDKSQKPHIRYREKFNLNRISDVELRQKWADKILKFLNHSFLNGDYPTIADIQAAILQPDAQMVAQKDSFFLHVTEFLELRTPILAEGTIKTLKNTHRLLIKFATEVLKKPYPDYADFDAVFPLRYQSWSYSPPRCHSANYYAKQLDHIRQFLSDAVEQKKVPVEPLWQSKKYHGKLVEVDDIALTLDEIERIYRCNLSDDSVYMSVRDTFVFACLVGGLRFSDFSSLKPSDFSDIVDAKGEKVKVIKVASTQKTSDKVIVPLHPIALEVLERNGGQMPKCTVNQVFNRYVKTIAEKAGITEGVSLRQNVAGKTKVVKMPKCDAVSSHTARRTFATVAYCEWKMPVGILMKITGHSTEAQFFKYIKLSKEFAALEMVGYMKK